MSGITWKKVTVFVIEVVVIWLAIIVAEKHSR